MNGIIGKKQDQTQGFLQDGTRVPLTVVSAMGNWVTQLKMQDKDGYSSVQLGFDIKKKPNKSILGHSKKAGLSQTPRFFREIRGEVENMQLGSQVNPSDVFKPGDIVDVTGVSKGKGFAGVVKRHQFKGGPRTHGQSDRERAPGSIGQTTTPGHVYKGKRMAGRMGHQNATVKNLEVIDITNEGNILIKGVVPGPRNGILIIRKVENKQSLRPGELKQSLRPGGLKKFVPLYKETSEKQEAISSENIEVQPTADQPQVEKTAIEEVQTEEKEVSSDAKALEGKKENAS